MPRKSKKPFNPKDRPYIPNVQGGWHAKSARYLDSKGRYTSREKALRDGLVDEGKWIRTPQITPVSDSLSAFEAYVVDSDNMVMPLSEDMPASGMANAFRAALKSPLIDKRPASWMPAEIRAKMLLSEHFYMTEGDASQVCSVPIELVAGEIVVDGPPALRDEIENILYKTQMADVLAELWLSLRVFGNAYPYEVWENKSLEGVIPLPPVHCHVGNDYSVQLSSEAMNLKKWEDEMIERFFPPAAYRQVEHHWNEQKPNVSPVGIEIPQRLMTPLKDIRGFSWNRYAMPMLSLAFRDLTDRIVHEDAVRAVTEGYKYQLWVFTIGDNEHPPLPGELSRLGSVLSAAVTERTGKLLWRGGLNVEIFVPQGLDQLLGRGYLGDKTRQFFRKMGITSRVVSGESPGVLGAATSGGASGDAVNLDVQLYLERVRHQEQKLMGWLRGVLEKWLRATSKAGLKELRTVKLHFPLTDFEMETRVKNIFGPAYREGAGSWTTYIKNMGLKPEVEKAYKEDEKDMRDKGLLDSPTTFKQTSETVTPQGATVKTTESVTSPGRPDKGEEEPTRSADPVEMQASQQETLVQAIAEAMRHFQINVQPPNISLTMPQPQVRVDVEGSTFHGEKQEPAKIDIHIPEMPAPIVNVESPKIDIHVPEQPAPVVNVNPDIDVNIPEQPAPNVTVEAAQIDVHVPEQPAPNVTVEAPQIDVHVPRQEPPIVNVEGARVEVPAPIVNVEPQIDVHVPEQAPPTVNVESPRVDVHVPEQPAPIVNVEAAQQDIHVNVPETKIDFSPRIEIPEQKPPDVKVDVTVPVPEVTLELPAADEEIEVLERNEAGQLKRARKTRKFKQD